MISNVKRLTKIMVHCIIVIAHLDSFDLTKDCISDRGSRIGYEVGILTGRRDWCRNDANPVTTRQPYTTTSRYQ